MSNVIEGDGVETVFSITVLKKKTIDQSTQGNTDLSAEIADGTVVLRLQGYAAYEGSREKHKNFMQGNRV